MGWTHVGERVPRTLRLLLVAVAWLLLLPPGPAAATGPSLPAVVEVGCERAGQLVAAGRHDDAVTLITGLREAAPDDATPACAAQYVDALIGLTTPPEPTLAERVGSAWTSFLDDHVTPWLVPVLALLGWSVLVLVLARLLLLAPRLVGNDWARLVSSRDWLAPALLVLAWVALLVSGLLATGLLHVVAPRPGAWTDRWGTLALLVVLLLASAAFWRGVRGRTRLAAVASVLTVASAGAVLAWVLLVHRLVDEPEPAPDLGPAVLVGLGAALAFAAAWGGGTRLTIRLDGAAEGSGISAEQIRLVANRLGSAPPRGLEVPVGTDASFLAPVSLDSLPANVVLAALDRLWKLSRPPTPWLLVVTVASSDLLSMSLTRNGQRIKTDIVYRETLLRPLREVMTADERAAVDLATFPAAFAVVTMARDQRKTTGLAGAVSWQSVGMQFLGALCADDDQETQQTVFALAVELDPGNLLARTSYWHALHRDAVDVASLRRYRSLLDALLGRRVEEDEPGRSTVTAPGSLDRKEAALRLRLLFTRVAVGINLRCLDASDTDGLEQRAGELLDEADRPVDHSGPEPVQWSEMCRTATYLVMSLAPFGLHPRPRDCTTHPEPENLGPAANYALGCYYASVVAEAERKNGIFLEAEVSTAVRHLELASAAPAMRTWRERDPQLAGLRRHSTYRATFPTSRQPPERRTGDCDQPVG